jgi:hypothetical protein
MAMMIIYIYLVLLLLSILLLTSDDKYLRIMRIIRI